MATGSTEPTVAPAAPHLKRVLGTWDLTWLCVVAITNMNLVPVVAAGGFTTLWLWLLALAFFFWPQGIAVIELSHRFPGEGGLYLWAKEMFGDFHGFMCGWCYWLTNMFFIPTLLFYLAGIWAFAGGKHAAALAENRLFFFLVSIGLLWLTVILNIRGLGVGKWVNNLGGMGTFVTAAVLIGLGIFTALRHGISIPAGSFRFGDLDWRIVSSFGVICFGLVGLELGPVMGDEIRDPKRSVPRAVLLGGVISGTLYVGATLCVLLAVPQKEMVVIQGVLQGVDRMTRNTALSWIMPPLGLVMILAIAGSTSAWISGSARIVFVSGLDRYLPRIFGRIHPRYATPHVALIGLAVLSSGIVSMSFIGATVKEAYVTLLDLSVLLQMLSFLYVYATLLAVAIRGASGSAYFGRAKIFIAALSGLIATTVGGIVAFVPSHQITSIWIFELKMFAGCGLFLALATFLFRYYSARKIPDLRSAGRAASLPEE
jgi:amino acid transporter